MKHNAFLSSRNIGLDFLRALLILEGVLYHAARSLPGGNNWYYVSGKNEADAFTALIEFVHTFRMEAFFFLSGMFSAMVILRKGTSFFYSNRRKRVIVPMISAFLFIPALMYLISTHFIKGEPLTTSGVLNAYTYMHHLWFLVSLTAMSFLVPVSFYRRIAEGLRRLPFSVLVATLIVAANAFFVVKFFVKDFGEWINLIPVTARFMVYYAAGYALYLNSDKIPEQARSFLLKSWFVAAMALGCWLVFYATFHFNITSTLKYIPVLCSSVFSVIFSYWVVFTFEKLRMKESRWVKGVVDSALVIYIMHYPLVISFSWLLDDYVPDSMPVSYVIALTGVGLVLSTVLYMIIKQSSLLSMLFGLKPAKPQVAPAASAGN